MDYDETLDLAAGLKDLSAIAADLRQTMADAFDPGPVQTFLTQTVTLGNRLESQLLVLRLSFGRLKSAFSDAMAPITGPILQGIQQAVYAATRWVSDLGLVTAALFGGAKASDSMAASQEKLRRSSGRAVKSLLAFDELQRLSRSSGGSSTAASQALPRTATLTPQLQQTVEKIRAILAPLQQIDFTAAKTAVEALQAALGRLSDSLGAGLLWAWHNVLVPLAAWTVEEAAPAAVNLLTAALEALGAALVPVRLALQALGTALAPVMAALGSAFTQLLQLATENLQRLTALFSEKTLQMSGAFQNLGSFLGSLWSRIAPAMAALSQGFGQTLQSMGTFAAGQLRAFTDMFSGLAAFLSGSFTGAWDRAWAGVKGVLKGAINGIIDLLNAMTRGLASGINGLVKTLNQFQVTVPSWVPGLGGKRFGFQLSPVSAPQIPYLAQGAVLPPNAPFLAVVGDQRHGTNIEAPLATIQEAVAQVMADFASSNLAGHEATVAMLRSILEAVLGIQVGDQVIGAAYDRYRARQAIRMGGALL